MRVINFDVRSLRDDPRGVAQVLRSLARVAAEAGVVSDHLPVVVDLQLPTVPSEPYR